MNENQVRASDAERERIAKMVNDAAGEGRLSLPEAEERLTRIYETTYRHELSEYVADLPAEQRRPGPAVPTGRFPTRLRIHAAVAAAVSALLIVRWIVSDVPFFFPAGPMFFLWGSFVIHTVMVTRIRRGYGPPWLTNRPAPR
jgi:uncharacterized protein DUF1707